MKKYEFIYQKYRHDILEGHLHYQQKLPSIRQSCQIFKVSQTSVEHAYEKLMLEGYIASQPQRGYYVCIQDQKIQLHKQIQNYQNKNQEKNYLYDFRSQTVSFDSFEMNIWKRYLKDVLNQKNMTTYGDSQGEYALREALSQYTYKMRGVISRPDQILIGSNFQSLLFVLCSLLPKNCIVGIEENTNLQVQRVFESYGYQVYLIRQVDEGLDFDFIRNHLIDILYINSACLGRKRKPISSFQKDELLQYTYEKHILILEDDYNGELTYASKDRYAIQGYDTYDHVIYFGSFSRLLLPSLRMSYVVLNQEYTRLYLTYKSQYGPSASKIEQLAFTQYILNGHLEKHVRKLKKEYREKNKIMKQVLHENCPYEYYLNEAYMTYVIYLHDINEITFQKTCTENNLKIPPIQNHILQISFASIPTQELKKALMVLLEILQKQKTNRS